MRMARQGETPVIPLWLVWLVALGFVVSCLGSFAILDNNEGLYAEIPREMLASHDWRLWVIPHLNGLPYMEKPPLLYWLTALSFVLFGESEWSARLVPALSSLACVAMLIHFGNVIKRPRVGRLAAVMFVSGVGVTVMSHVLMFDMLLTALLTAALLYAYRYVEEGKARFLRMSYAFLALALLAKGLVALVLFGLVMIAFTAATSRSLPDFLRVSGKWFEPWALLVFFAIAAPWHVVASYAEPIFAWFYFVNEHVLRFMGKREPHDYYSGPWWYYLPRMVIYLFPWSFLLVSLFGRARQTNDQVKLQRFLWMSWLVPLFFFSISSAKANYYLVAVMPFAAFHLAIALDNREPLAGGMKAIPGLLIAVLAAALCIALTFRGLDEQRSVIIWGLEQGQFLLMVFGGILVLALACAIVSWRISQSSPLIYLVLPIWISIVLMSVLKVLEPSISTRHVTRYLQNELSGRTVYLYRDFEQQSSLPFYIKKPVPIIEPRSNDLLWGDKLRPGNNITIDGKLFEQRMQHESVAVVVMDRQLKDFKSSGFFHLLKEKKRIGERTVFYN